MKRKTKTHSRAGKIFARILVTILIVVLVLLGVMYGVPLFEHVDKTRVSGSADWMQDLDDALPLSEITLPGTHDSATQYVGLTFFSRCQDGAIRDQLDRGYRYLDIRLGMDEEGMKLMHGFVNCKTGPMLWSPALGLETVLDQCYTFLEEHPTETVLFAVKQEHGSLTAEAFAQALEAVIAQQPDLWFTENRIPTLGEARGKLVLLRRYVDRTLPEDAEGHGLSLNWPNQSGHGNVSKHTEATVNGTYTLWVQDRYEYGAEDKWNAFTAGLATAPVNESSAAIHFLSTKGTLPYGHVWSFAKTLNGRLTQEQPPLSGWVILDFGTAELAEQIYRTNFQ